MTVLWACCCVRCASTTRACVSRCALTGGGGGGVGGGGLGGGGLGGGGDGGGGGCINAKRARRINQPTTRRKRTHARSKLVRAPVKAAAGWVGVDSEEEAMAAAGWEAAAAAHCRSVSRQTKIQPASARSCARTGGGGGLGGGGSGGGGDGGGGGCKPFKVRNRLLNSCNRCVSDRASRAATRTGNGGGGFGGSGLGSGGLGGGGRGGGGGCEGIEACI
jgi:hypothetical protein